MTPEPVATCETCHNFQPFGQAQLPIGQKSVIFAVAKRLKFSAEAGCQSCLLICNALSLFREPWDEQDLEDAVELQVSSGQPLLVLFRPRNRTGVYLDIYTDPGEIHASSRSSNTARPCVCARVLTPSPSLFLKMTSFLLSGQPRVCSDIPAHMSASISPHSGWGTA